MMSCFQCLLGGRWKGVRYDEDGEVQQCLFCDFANGLPDKAGNVKHLVYQDDLCACFESKAREASTHLLIVPKRHVQNWKSPETGKLLPHMIQVADRLHPGAELHFHNPPYNTIDHLHLHVLVPPWKNGFARLKQSYAPWKFWLVDARNLLESSEDSHHLNP
eukprot:TRINITY_DN15090_c0_g1_i2.p1 TRINITY_DN15090_c0_g1~~TRINITY_DN15090_c0_g1_i2.p1  ORF type:complete len:162 (-),score=3.61 TRINITY_DN15090_c0_g1_i2:110-595(-)